MSSLAKVKPCVKCGYEYDRHTFFRGGQNCYNLAKQAVMKREFETLCAKVKRPMKGNSK